MKSHPNIQSLQNVGLLTKKVEPSAILMYDYKEHETRLLSVPEIRKAVKKGMKK